MKKENLGYLQIIIAEFFVSLPLILVRFGKDLGNQNLAFFRVCLAFVFLGVFSLFYRKYGIAPIKKEKIKILFFGALHGFIILASFMSLNLLTIASATILQATIAVWIAIFSIIILKEKINKKVIIALIVSFIGLVIIINPLSIFMEKSLFGIAAALFVGVFGGLIYVLSKTFRTYDKYSLTFWQNLIATPFLIPLLTLSSISFNFNNISILIGLGIFGALSFVILFTGLEKVKGQNASVLTLLYVVFSIILAILFFREIPTFREVIGGILILIGAYLSTR
jgi:drug/metabolite transporter (DMT)-like permease